MQIERALYSFSVFSLIALMLVSTPVDAQSNVQSAPRTTLHRANAEPDTLDPHKMKLLSELNILREIFSGLTKSDADGRIVGAAARSWEVSEDGTRYTFHLREDLTWSDGHPLTSHDFLAGYRRLFDPATAAQSAAFLYTIKNAQKVNAGELPVEDLGVEAPDQQTLIITLKGPNPAFPSLIISGYTSPFPRHAYEKFGEDWVKAENFVSNGPFRLAEWSPRDRIRVVKNPLYYDANEVTLTEVIFTPVADGMTAVKQFRAGELDIASPVPINQIEQLRELMPEAVRTFPDLATYYLVPNTKDDALSDARVRNALSLALDRRVIAGKVMRAMALPAWRFSPPNVSDYHGDLLAMKDEPMPDRLAEARALLDAAGYGPGNPLTLTLRTTDSQEARNAAVAIRAMWQQLGVQTELFNAEIKSHYSDLSNGNFQIALAGYYGWDDPFEFLSLFMAATTQVSFNYGRYDNPLYDQTLEEALTMADIEKRHATMAAAEAILLGDAAVIPVYHPIARTLVSEKVIGYHDNRLNVHPSEYISLKD